MLKRILAEVKEFKKDAFLTPFFMILEVLFETLIPLTMASIIDNGVEKGDLNHIYKMGLVMAILALGGLFSGIMGGKYGAKASTGFARNLRKSMFENIQTFSFSNIDKFSTAGLITRLTTDVTNLQNAFQMVLRMCTRAPISMICAMTMAFIVNARLACIYLVAVIFLATVLLTIASKATKYFKQVFEKYDGLNASVQENIGGIRVVKAFVREEHETKKFRNAVDKVYQMFVNAESLIVFNGPVMQFTVYTCIMLISWLGAKMIVTDQLTTGELMSLLAYCMNILMSLMMLSMVFVMITMSMASAERISEVLNETANLSNPENPIMEVPNGSIDFEHVIFRYRQSTGDPVLRDVSLSIKSGETIGILGATGSAKSSLVSLISRLYDVTEGAVKVGGINVKDYDMEALRNQVSVVLQKNVLFTGTILDNLRWGNPDATEEECRHACQLACADEFIERFPDKYNTRIEQGGNNVSGGQKQRLCIARALLKKPKILVLDDSTSAVDTATDARIRRAFAEEIPNTTKIIISQRISSIQNADRIIVMENGEIDGFDTPANLLANNAIYQEVYDAQMNGGGDFDEKGRGDH